MGCLLIPVLIALLGWANAAIVRLFQRWHAGPVWWAALLIAWLAGALLGVWSGFFFEYQPSPRLRVAGAPVPGAFFHWEGPPGEEQWSDYITPAPLLFAGSNILILAMLAAVPVGVAFWLRPRRTRAGEQRSAAPSG
jgi:hypothetical protein